MMMQRGRNAPVLTRSLGDSVHAELVARPKPNLKFGRASNLRAGRSRDRALQSWAPTPILVPAPNLLRPPCFPLRYRQPPTSPLALAISHISLLHTCGIRGGRAAIDGNATNEPCAGRTSSRSGNRGQSWPLVPRQPRDEGRPADGIET